MKTNPSLTKRNSIMAQDIKASISYRHDPGNGSLPDSNHDAEILVSHHDEENHKVLIHDIRGSEPSYSLDLHGFQPQTSLNYSPVPSMKLVKMLSSHKSLTCLKPCPLSLSPLNIHHILSNDIVPAPKKL